MTRETRTLLLLAFALLVGGVMLRSCYVETMRWIANEKAFCASHGMRWENGNDRRNGSCVEGQRLAARALPVLPLL